MAYEEEEKSLAYDLRVFYAGIVGKKLVKIQESEESKDYANWFRNLRLIFPIIFSRVDNDRKEIKKEYKTILEKCNKIVNENEKTFFNKNCNAKAVFEIENVLMELNHFIYRVLHKTKQLGENINIRGLN